MPLYKVIPIIAGLEKLACKAALLLEGKTKVPTKDKRV